MKNCKQIATEDKCIKGKNRAIKRLVFATRKET